MRTACRFHIARNGFRQLRSRGMGCPYGASRRLRRIVISSMRSLLRLVGPIAEFTAILFVSDIWADDAGQLRVPPGFVVTQYADDRLAHDIFSMTIDSLGRVVVSGPGYV